MMKKTALITGAAGNLGRAVCQEFLDNDYTIYASLGPGEEPGFINSDRLVTNKVNLLDETAASDYVDQVLQEAGDIDVAIFLVGGFAMDNIVATSSADIDKMVSLNFKTAYHMVRPLLAKMESSESKLQIVLVGARPALQASAGKDVVAYSLSKGMIFHLAELINAGYNDKGINCTVMVPSIIDTPPNRKAMPDANFDDWVKPEHIAKNIFFLTTGAGRSLRKTFMKVYGNS